MGVGIGFWERNDIYEPLRQNRWWINFDNLSNYGLYAKECSIPEYQVSSTEHRLMTHYFKLPGILKWKPVTIKFVSVIGDKATLNVDIQTILEKFGYKNYYEYQYTTTTDSVSAVGTVNKEKKDREMVVKTRSYNIIQNSLYGPNHQSIKNNTTEESTLEINQINENGDVIQTWSLYNWFISGVNYGTLSYANEDLLETTITIEYDFALLTDKNFWNIISKQKAEKEAKEALEKEMEAVAQRLAEEEQKRKIEEQRQKDAQDLLLIEQFYNNTTDEQRAALAQTEEGRAFLNDMEKKELEIEQRNDARERMGEERATADQATADSTTDQARAEAVAAAVEQRNNDTERQRETEEYNRENSAENVAARERADEERRQQEKADVDARFKAEDERRAEQTAERARQEAERQAQEGERRAQEAEEYQRQNGDTEEYKAAQRQAERETSEQQAREATMAQYRGSR